jgi:hypothetical protein
MYSVNMPVKFRGEHMEQEREITEGEGRLHNKELHNLLPSIHRSEQEEKDWCVT